MRKYLINGWANAKMQSQSRDIISLSTDLKWQHVSTTFILKIAWSFWGFFGEGSGVWLLSVLSFHIRWIRYFKPCWNLPVTLLLMTLCQLCVATLPAAPPQHCCPLTKKQLVARKHVNAVYPVLDIRYCGVPPLHTCQTSHLCVTSPFKACCSFQLSATEITFQLISILSTPRINIFFLGGRAKCL